MTFVTSSDRTIIESPSLLGSAFPFLVEFNDIMYADHYSFVADQTPGIWAFSLPFCIPTEGAPKVVNMSNFTMSVRYTQLAVEKYNAIMIGGSATEYSQVIAHVSNFDIFDITGQFNNILYIPMTANDQLFMTDIMVTNSSLDGMFYFVDGANKLVAERITVKD